MPRFSLSATLLLVVLALSAAAARAAVAPEYFDIPVGHPIAGGIAADGDGNIWLGTGSRSDAPELARLTTATGAVGIFPTPKPADVGCCANLVRSLTYEPVKQKIWFSQSDGVIGTATPALVVPGTSSGIDALLLSTQLRNPGRSLFTPDIWDLAADPHASGAGKVWFTERSTTNVDPYPGARIASMGDAVGVPAELGNIALQGGRTTLDPLRYDPKPSGIAVAPDGQPWFAESDPGNPGWRIGTPRGGGPDYDEYLVAPCAPVSPCSGSFTGTGITDVAVAPDNSVWFTNELRREIGRLSPDRGTFTAYRLTDIDVALGAGRPLTMTAASDGTIWVTIYGGISAPNANAIVKLTPQSREDADPGVDLWKLGPDRIPFAITDDRRGSIWFSVSAASSTTPGRFARLAGVVGGGTPTPPTPPTGPTGPTTPTTPTTPPPPARTIRAATAAPPGRPTVNGDSASIDQICVGPPEDRCSLVYIISAGEYVTGFPNTRTDDRDRRNRALVASAAAKKKPAKRRARRARAVIVGQKYVTLRGGQRATVRVTLNATGRRLLRRAGRLTLFMTVTQRGKDGVGKRVKALKVTFRAKRARRAPGRKRGR